VVLAIVTSVNGVGLGGIKFRNSGRDGQLLVWWPSFSHSAQGGGMRGGWGAVGSFCFLIPPAVAGGVGSMGVVGVVGVRIGITMGRPSYGWGTISGGCKYHTGIANTILGSVSVVATWKAYTPGGG
jgi:hypothetical protein